MNLGRTTQHRCWMLPSSVKFWVTTYDAEENFDNGDSELLLCCIVPPAAKKAATYCANNHYGRHYDLIELTSQRIPKDINLIKPLPKITLPCIWVQHKNQNETQRSTRSCKTKNRAAPALLFFVRLRAHVGQTLPQLTNSMPIGSSQRVLRRGSGGCCFFLETA